MFVVDTNVLIYAADQDSPGHARCRELVLDWRNQAAPWYLTWGIVYEFLRVTTHHRVFRRPWTADESWAFLTAILAGPSVSLLVETQRHGEILTSLIAEVPDLSGNLLHDAHIVTLMREHGIRTIYTRDSGFHRFAGLEVRDPLR